MIIVIYRKCKYCCFLNNIDCDKCCICKCDKFWIVKNEFDIN